MVKKQQQPGHQKGARSATRSQFTVQKCASVKSHTVKPRENDHSLLVKRKFHKNIPMSNHDLLQWCRYLNIPIKDVLSRDQTVPQNHKQALFIYNLEPSYMNGSHWVATEVINKTWCHQLF